MPPKHSPARALDTVAARGSQGGKILYIEDTEENVNLLRLILRHLPGVQLLAAPTAESGIPIAIKEQPDLILMDIDLPGMNGIEALHILRDNRKTHNIPIVAISANTSPRCVKSIKAANFNDYISKPFNIRKMPGTLAGYMRKPAPVQH